MAAFRLLGCRDYARVDFRVSAADEVFVLEVNPNPDFSHSAGLVGALTAAGITHAEFTVALVRHALARGWPPGALAGAVCTSVSGNEARPVQSVTIPMAPAPVRALERWIFVGGSSCDRP